MATSDNQPDFESMTPEELQAWMETLAERQGATEGFTTEDRMDVAEVDPDSVDVQDNYIPYGKTAEEWAQIQADERAERERRKAASATQETPQAQTPPPAEEPAQAEPAEEGMDWLSGLASPVSEDQAAETDAPDMDLSALGQTLDDADADDDMIDLSGLDDLDLDIDLGLGDIPSGDPMDWLDGLVATEDEPEAPEMDTFDEVEEASDTLEWLETLARQQGGSEEEMVTRPAEGDGATLEDPAEWLETLAANADISSGDDAEDDDDPEALTGKVFSDLDRGVSDPDAMKNWMDNMLELGATRDDVPDYIEEDDDDDDMPEKGEIPDWLLEQMGEPPQLDEDTQPSEDQIIADLGLDVDIDDEPTDWMADGEFGAVEAEADIEFEALDDADAADMPDWLQEEAADDADEAIAGDIPDWLREELPEGLEDEQAIFTKPDAIDDDSDLDQTDSWVEAFELERQMRMQGLSEIPEDWLQGDPPRVDTRVIMDEVSAAPQLQSAEFDEEEELQAGEPEAVPGWLGIDTPEAEAEAEAETADMPDWLREEEAEQKQQATRWLEESGLSDAEDVPRWLLDTGTLGELPPDVSEQVDRVLAGSSPAPPPEQPAAPIVPADDAPIDVAATLQSARQQMQAGEVAESLTGYEAVVRVNQNLDVVVEDLTKAIKEGPHKHNAAVHRVLGDGLMRQGRLQDALDTYRKALNLL